MKRFSVKDFKRQLRSSTTQLFRFKVNYQLGGPGFYSEFYFSIRPVIEEDKKGKYIYLEFRDNFREIWDAVFKWDSHPLDFSLFVEERFVKGIENFIEEIEDAQTGISNSFIVTIEIYIFHPVDSKPVANEFAMKEALKGVFKDELNIKLIRNSIIEEVDAMPKSEAIPSRRRIVYPDVHANMAPMSRYWSATMPPIPKKG